MPDLLRQGNDPSNGVIEVLGESGAVRAKLYAATTDPITPTNLRQISEELQGRVSSGIHLPGGGTAGPPIDRARSTHNVGELALYTQTDEQSAGMSGRGTCFIGGGGMDGNFTVRSAAGAVTIELNGATGDITLGNADCAEEFDVDDDVVPGAVVVITSTGHLALARDPYDRKVVGIVSGLGQYRPGLVLDRRRSNQRRLPVAVLGKVMCLVDAEYAPIRAGDLLTSSPRPGYAMAVRDWEKAVGCVIGKSLTNVAAGQGGAPVFVMNR